MILPISVVCFLLLLEQSASSKHCNSCSWAVAFVCPTHCRLLWKICGLEPGVPCLSSWESTPVTTSDKEVSPGEAACDSRPGQPPAEACLASSTGLPSLRGLGRREEVKVTAVVAEADGISLLRMCLRQCLQAAQLADALTWLPGALRQW